MKCDQWFVFSANDGNKNTQRRPKLWHWARAHRIRKSFACGVSSWFFLTVSCHRAAVTCTLLPVNTSLLLSKYICKCSHLFGQRSHSVLFVSSAASFSVKFLSGKCICVERWRRVIYFGLLNKSPVICSVKCQKEVEAKNNKEEIENLKKKRLTCNQTFCFKDRLINHRNELINIKLIKNQLFVGITLLPKMWHLQFVFL